MATTTTTATPASTGSIITVGWAIFLQNGKSRYEAATCFAAFFEEFLRDSKLFLCKDEESKMQILCINVACSNPIFSVINAHSSIISSISIEVRLAVKL